LEYRATKPGGGWLIREGESAEVAGRWCVCRILDGIGEEETRAVRHCGGLSSATHSFSFLHCVRVSMALLEDGDTDKPGYYCTVCMLSN